MDRLATHVLIHARDRLELTVTPSALKALEELSSALSNEHPLRVSALGNSINVVNSLGPGVVVTLFNKVSFQVLYFLFSSSFLDKHLASYYVSVWP